MESNSCTRKPHLKNTLLIGMHLIAYNSPTTVISDQNAFNKIAMLKKKKRTKERRINIKID